MGQPALPSTTPAGRGPALPCARGQPWRAGAELDAARPRRLPCRVARRRLGCLVLRGGRNLGRWSGLDGCPGSDRTTDVELHRRPDQRHRRSWPRPRLPPPLGTSSEKPSRPVAAPWAMCRSSHRWGDHNRLPPGHHDAREPGEQSTEIASGSGAVVNGPSSCCIWRCASGALRLATGARSLAFRHAVPVLASRASRPPTSLTGGSSARAVGDQRQEQAALADQAVGAATCLRGRAPALV